AALDGRAAVHFAGGSSPSASGSDNHWYLGADPDPALAGTEYTIFAVIANATYTNAALVNVLQNDQPISGWSSPDDTYLEAAVIGYGGPNAWHHTSAGNFSAVSYTSSASTGILEG